MQLLLALYAEGPSDTRFLPLIIQRVARSITAPHRLVGVLDLTIISKKQGIREECIVFAARDAYGCHALIVHSDADDKSSERARKERIEPGFNQVLHSSEDVCKDLIPIIPVQMIEAWMLADHNALREAIGTNMSAQTLGLPARPALVERDANPKHTLNEVVRKANAGRSRRHQKIDINAFHERLARDIDLNILDLVTSYREFKRDLANTLAKLHFIPFNLPEKE